MLEQQKTKKGFTIIEVVLVLAIAGLIFLMVFLALPNLQRSQKDTQRRDDLARFQTAITNYQSNNRGKLPGTSANQESTAKDAYNDFIDNYLRVNGDSFNDPDGQPYVVGKVCLDMSKGNGSCTETTSLNQTFADGTNMTEFTAKKDTADWKAGDTINGHTIYVYQNATCDGENIVESTGTRKVAFLYKLEGGGWYCGNN